METEHSHANLARWIQKALPRDWNIVLPSTTDAAPSAFPSKNNRAVQEALQQVLELQPPLPFPALEDMLAGHCETCAVKLSEHVAASIKHRTSYQNPLAAGYASLQS